MAKPDNKPSTRKSSTKRTQPPPSNTEGPDPVAIVGLGASAGGLEALKAFFSNVPATSHRAYVVVVHMPSNQPSIMPDLLNNVTPIPVATATDGDRLLPDRVYVIPPNKEIGVFKGRLQLLEIEDKRLFLPIDAFLKSLALDSGRRSAAVILSGTGTDGTQGIREIKINGGLVVVQTHQSAEYDGMPRSAIRSGMADMILPPDQMPEHIERYFKHRRIADGPLSSSAEGDQQVWLNKIFALLRAKIGHDFSGYKLSTILRRINRRMGLNQIDGHDQYIRFLKEHPGELDALFRELLIGVTSFFRDVESYNVLSDKILPDLFEQMNDDDTFRAWIPGCSTGEEVYSMAMVIRERLAAGTKMINLQMFGTDIDNRAIDKAREGLYSSNIATDVGQERLKRYFIKEGDFYRVRKEIRDCVVFSVQDIIKDPPFSRLNLLCCRNLLIYLDTAAQKKVIPLFHYTLAPEGILMLGSSETIGAFTNLFQTIDKKWKIFKRKEVPLVLRQQVDFPSGPATHEFMNGTAAALGQAPKADIGHVAQQAILRQFAPTAVLVDGKGGILHVQGRTGKYLEPPSGPPTMNILDMAREGLRIELSSALRAAKSTRRPVVRTHISVRTNGDTQMIDLHVRPQHEPKELDGRLLVVFQDIDAAAGEIDPQGAKTDPGHKSQLPGRLAELERELQSTRESHQTTIEELESSNEELKSTNEELQSSNEELQSTNEEMESSKEELQSLNEELQTVNAELQSKVEELSAAHDDMRNLLNSTQIATIFVDNQLRVKRFTSEATAIINLIQTDIGRPLQHVVSNLDYNEMISDLADVMESLVPRHMEVRTQAGEWFNMSIVPYRTTDNRIDGAVLTFAVIDDQKNAQRKIDQARDEMGTAWQLVRNVFDMNARPLAVLDKDGRLIIGNEAFHQLMELEADELEGRNIFDLKNILLQKSDLRQLLQNALVSATDFQSTEVDISIKNRKKSYYMDGQIIALQKGAPYRLLLSFIEK